MPKLINQLIEVAMGKSKYGPIKIMNTKSNKRVMVFELTNHE